MYVSNFCLVLFAVFVFSSSSLASLFFALCSLLFGRFSPTPPAARVLGLHACGWAGLVRLTRAIHCGRAFRVDDVGVVQPVVLLLPPHRAEATGWSKAAEVEVTRQWRLGGVTRMDVHQADVAPLMAAVLGVPFPVNSVGLLPFAFMPENGYRIRALKANAQQLAAHVRHRANVLSSRALWFRPFGGTAAMEKALEQVDTLLETYPSMKRHEVRVAFRCAPSSAWQFPVCVVCVTVCCVSVRVSLICHAARLWWSPPAVVMLFCFVVCVSASPSRSRVRCVFRLRSWYVITCCWCTCVVCTTAQRTCALQALEGMRYYQTYSWTFIMTCTVLAYFGWLAVQSAFITTNFTRLQFVHLRGASWKYWLAICLVMTSIWMCVPPVELPVGDNSVTHGCWYVGDACMHCAPSFLFVDESPWRYVVYATLPVGFWAFVFRYSAVAMYVFRLGPPASNPAVLLAKPFRVGCC